MMTQFLKLLLVFACTISALFSGGPVMAADEVTVTCNSSCTAPELPLQSLSWASGSSWQERIVVDNQASLSRDLQGELEVSGNASLIAQLQASWKNGSHRVIREGSLSDISGAIPLNTVPAQSKRVFYLAVALPKTIDNTAQNKSFTLHTALKVTDVPKGAKVATSTTSKSTKGQAKTAASAVLGQSVNHADYPLPNLQSRLLSSPPIQAADQIVQAARKQLWWGWLIVAIETVMLTPWRFGLSSRWQRFTLEMTAIALAGLLSGWPASLAASLWLCVDLGRLSQYWSESLPFTMRRNIKNNLAIPNEAEEPARHAGAAVAGGSSTLIHKLEPEDLSTSSR